MFFLHSCMNLITISIRVLESKAVYSAEVCEEMLRLRMCLNFWLDDKVVFVSKLTGKMKKLRCTGQRRLGEAAEVCKEKEKSLTWKTFCFKCSRVHTQHR